MNQKTNNCSLHGQSFQFYCQRCSQPVCRKCTIIGPHHTQIHSLTKISIAYEKKVQQIRGRISIVVQSNRQKVFKIIRQINCDVQGIEIVRRSIDCQNNKQKQRLMMILIKEYQNNRNLLHSCRQNLTSKCNQINDLGFNYKQIKNPIELLGSHQKIIQGLKDLHDRVQLLLFKKTTLNPYTKQLTQVRVNLKQIQSLNLFYQDKIKTINNIIEKTNGLPSFIQPPKVQYQGLLNQLNSNLASIHHQVCHFCGKPFTFQQINKPCQKNNATFNLSFQHVPNSAGHCKINPDSNKIGTHRHFFAQPKNTFLFYIQQGQSSFKTELNTILLKVKTLCKIKKLSVKKLFKDNDKTQNLHCPKIVFDYIFIQVLGLSQKQKQIVSCMAQTSKQNPNLLRYSQIVQKLQEIDF